MEREILEVNTAYEGGAEAWFFLEDKNLRRNRETVKRTWTHSNRTRLCPLCASVHGVSSFRKKPRPAVCESVRSGGPRRKLLQRDPTYSYYYAPWRIRLLSPPPSRGRHVHGREKPTRPVDFQAPPALRCRAAFAPLLSPPILSLSPGGHRPPLRARRRRARVA